jgi:hypothetical protein
MATINVDSFVYNRLGFGSLRMFILENFDTAVMGFFIATQLGALIQVPLLPSSTYGSL